MTEGVITARASNGFYIQDTTPDANANTSDAIFIFTSSSPAASLVVGDSVVVSGTVAEFIPGLSPTDANNLSITQISAVAADIYEVASLGSITPIAVGPGGALPPTTSIMSDTFATPAAGPSGRGNATVFNPTVDAIDWFEAFEGMVLSMSVSRVIGPTNGFGEVWVVPHDWSGVQNVNQSGGVTISPTDFVPEKIQLDDTLFTGGMVSAKVGDILGSVTGVVSYSFGNYEVLPWTPVTITTPSSIAPEVTPLNDGAGRFTVASYNVENLAGSDAAARFMTLAQQIIDNLKSPSIIALQEIQDNNGTTNDSVVAANVTLQKIVDAITAAGGPAYQWLDSPPDDDQDGGAPGANIRNAYLYDPTEVTFVAGSLTRLADTNLANGDAFDATRKPVVATFLVDGSEVTIVNNHLSSKGQTPPLFGHIQPPVDPREGQRTEQAQIIKAVVDQKLAVDPNAKIIVTGDMNSFTWEAPMQALLGDGKLISLADTQLPTTERYSYIFNGATQKLDHMFVTKALAGPTTAVDIVHVNAEFAAAVNFSDHDPMVAQFTTGSTSPMISLVASGQFKHGAYSTSNPSAEISAHDGSLSKLLFVTNDASNRVDILDISNPLSPVAARGLSSLDLASFATTLGADINLTSVAVEGGKVAVSFSPGGSSATTDKSVPGTVVVWDVAMAPDGTVSASNRKAYTVGSLPDMITFFGTSKIVVANEGEPVSNSNNPLGSISVIDLALEPGVAGAVKTVDFAAYIAGLTAGDAASDLAALKAAGVRIRTGMDGNPAADLEPEYISIQGTKAYVTLQENNAVAIIDLSGADPVVESIKGLGRVNFNAPGFGLDASDRDGPSAGTAVNIVNWPVFGLRQPDAIATFTVAGQTYYVTANEGDAGEGSGITGGEDAMIRVGNSGFVLNATNFPNAATLKDQANLGRLEVLPQDGNTDGNAANGNEEIVTIGTRSFTVFDQAGNVVWDSGRAFEDITAAAFPNNFNANHSGSNNNRDDRSDNKGPEPEGIAVGEVNGKQYAFIGLERMGGVMAFDVSNPAAPTFVQYINTRDFTTAPTATTNTSDLGAEGLDFIPASESPNGMPLLSVTNEVSGTTRLFEIKTPAAFTLQLLHLADGEAGLLAAQTAPNLAALVDAFDNSFANTLILAGGDNFLPGPFLAAGTDPSVGTTLNSSTGSTIAAGANLPIAAVDIGIHNIIGVEASGVGNHEWDLGSTVFASAIASGSGWVGARFPYVSSNLNTAADSAISGRVTNTLTAPSIAEASTLQGRLVPAAVITEGGEKIGVLGVTTQLLNAISSPSGTTVVGTPPNVDNIPALAPILQPVINQLIAQGANKIVLLSHLQTLNNERTLAPLLTGVDIVLAAGSNTRLGDANDVPVAFPDTPATSPTPIRW